MLILDPLIQTICNTAAYNAESQAAPACILWSDPNRQWQAAILLLQALDAGAACPGPSTACTA